MLSHLVMRKRGAQAIRGRRQQWKIVWKGAADMKGAIAALLAAANGFVNVSSSPGSISLIITGDEEGVAEFGTVKMIEWMIANNQILTFV